MKALEGLSKADTLRLVEIEHYVKTGKRPDGLQVTDEWVDEAMGFLAGHFREMLDAWSKMFALRDEYLMVDKHARGALRAWRGGRRGAEESQAFEGLDGAIRALKAKEKALREAEASEAA